MLYYLFDWLDKALDFPGAGVFQYISFRAAASMVTSLIIMLLLGKPFIRWMKNKMGMMDEVRTELGLEGASRKAQTPTMGGLLILTAIIVPTLLFLATFLVTLCALHLSDGWVALITLAVVALYALLLYLRRQHLQQRFTMTLTPNRPLAD